MSEPRTAALWDESAYAKALADVGQHVIAGYQRHEINAEVVGPCQVLSAGAARRDRPNPYVVSRKVRAPSDKVSPAELAQMRELYAQFGEQKGICERIAAQLSRPRSPQCVGNWLDRVGDRPLGGRR